VYGGIDAHKKESVLAVVGLDGVRESLVRVRTTPEGLDEIVDRTRALKLVVIEASTSGKAVARYLRDRGVNAHLIHADALVAALRKNKSDALDAYDLARIASVGAFTRAYVATPEEDALRALVARGVQLRRRLSELTCQLKATAQAHMLPEPIGKLDTPACRRRWEALRVGSVQQQLVKSRLVEYEFVLKELEAVRMSVIEAAGSLSGVPVLLTIPGVDVFSIAGILAFTGDITRYPESRKYASATGLTPRKDQSGDKDRGGRITKKGHSILRTLYVELSWQVIRFPGQLRNQHLKLEKRKGKKKAIVATARKLSVIVWTMLTRNEPYKFAIERNAVIKKWRLRAVRTLLHEGKRQDAARLLRSHDPYRERIKWDKERGSTTA
jgi:transposase